MEALRTYLLGIAVTVMAVTLLSALLKEGALRRAVRRAGGGGLILAVLTCAAVFRSAVAVSYTPLPLPTIVRV